MRNSRRSGGQHMTAADERLPERWQVEPSSEEVG
jgi:hypothetical protein